MGSCPLQKAQQLSREGYKQKPVLKPVSRSIRLQEKIPVLTAWRYVTL